MSSILAIDIGSTKICTLIAEYNNDKLHITGAGISKAQGLKKGSIVNIDLASKAIKKSIGDATRVAGTVLRKAYVSISGAYTKNLKSFGIVNVPNREITVKEVNRAMQTALYNANIPVEYELLHALPYDFRVDEQDNIQDPVGMSGSRLEVSVYIVAIQKSTLDNLRKTVTLAGVEIQSIVLSGYASSIAILNEDEKDLGVCVIDLGGATSDLVIHLGNAIRYHDFLGVGGSHITGDLSMALHTPLGSAEKIKIEHGSLLSQENSIIELPIIGNENSMQEVSLEVVSNVIYARVEETLMILAKQIEKSGFKNQLGSGIVLTGGMTKLEGMHEIASPIFDNMPVRIAKSKNIEGLFDSLKDPAFSTVLGLVRYGAGEHTLYEIDSNKRLLARDEIAENAVKMPSGEENYSNKNEISEEKNENIADIMISSDSKEGTSDFFKKMWRKATQIF
ncbi:MAG: cell division protein FtsA [Campylobacterota bacterium]|nr:cell division protein FtsA [Campylobacterota bacterium]